MTKKRPTPPPTPPPVKLAEPPKPKPKKAPNPTKPPPPPPEEPFFQTEEYQVNLYVILKTSQMISISALYTIVSGFVIILTFV